MCSTCRILAERNEKLQAELEQLRHEMRARDYRAPREFRLTASEERILGMLIKANRTLSADAIFDSTRELPGTWAADRGDRLVHVYLSKLRGKLRRHGLSIETVRGYGYRIEPLSRARLLNWNKPAEDIAA